MTTLSARGRGHVYAPLTDCFALGTFSLALWLPANGGKDQGRYCWIAGVRGQKHGVATSKRGYKWGYKLQNLIGKLFVKQRVASMIQ